MQNDGTGRELLSSPLPDPHRGAVLRLWLAVLVLKLAIAAWLPLTKDETYYWVWSYHLQLSYYDHPPMIAWLYWLGHPFEGLGHAVRWPGVFLGHLTLLVWWPLIGRMLGPDQRRWWFALAILSPLIGPGTILVVPDVPLLFVWSVAILVLLRFTDRPTEARAFALGTVVGLGFISKYHMALFVPLAGLWLWRGGHLAAMGPRLAIMGLAGFAATSWPVWVWNATHHWSSFLFQLGRGLGATKWHVEWTTSYLAGQLALIFPTVVYCALRARHAPRWLVIFGWGPLVFFLLSSFRGEVEANWTSTAVPALIALALYGRGRFVWARITTAIWALALVLAITHAAWNRVPFLGDRFVREVRDFDFVHPLVRRYQPFYANSYQMASRLSYDLGVPVAQLPGVGRRSAYQDFPTSIPTANRYYVIVDRGQAVPVQSWNQHDTEVRRIPVGDDHEIIEFGRVTVP